MIVQQQKHGIEILRLGIESKHKHDEIREYEHADVVKTECHEKIPQIYGKKFVVGQLHCFALTQLIVFQKADKQKRDA
jgi:hypothetical protein